MTNNASWVSRFFCPRRSKAGDECQERSSVQEERYFPLASLPIEILLTIKDYLSSHDYYRVLNVCKHSQIRALKSHSIAYNLPSKESWKYYQNENHFQDIVSAVLYSTRRQLSLTLGELRGIASPVINSSNQLHLLCNLKQLTLRNVAVDMDLLGKVENISRLWLEGFASTTVLPNLNGRNIESIVIKSFPELSDVSTISGIARISIVFCSKLADISPLKDCRDLTIQSCVKIENISMLGNQDQLTLAYCPNISVVDNLNTVGRLTLRECDRIRDLSSVGDVSDLTISLKTIERLPTVSRAKKLTFDAFALRERSYSNHSTFTGLEEVHLRLHSADLNDVRKLPVLIEDSIHRMSIHQYYGKHLQMFTFRNVYFLELFQAWNLTDVSMLGHIPILHLITMYRLTSTAGLGKPSQKQVLIEDCRVTEINDLRDVKKVQILNTYAKFNIEDLQYCEEISIADCALVTALKKPLIHCRKFSISNCRLFDSLSGLEEVDYVEVVNCGKMKNIVKVKDKKKGNYPFWRESWF